MIDECAEVATRRIDQAGRVPDPDWDELTEAFRLDLQRRALSRTLRDPRGDPDWMFEWFERKRF